MKETSKTSKIRIISPSGAVKPEYIDGAYEKLTSWGYDVEIGKYAKEKYGRFAGTDKQRIADLQAAIDDKTINAILCSRGGYGLARIIDKINFDALHTHFKWLIGFSDISVLHARINNQDKPTLHAIMARHLTELPDSNPSISYLKQILDGNYPNYHIPAHTLNRHGKVEAYLVGGNLSVIAGLWGTPYELDLYDAILFIEDIGEDAYKIDRMMQNLRLSGAFSKIKGLIVGHFTSCNEDEEMNISIKKIILDATEQYQFPVCMNFPAGHENKNYPLILGKKINLKIDESGTYLNFK